MMDKILNFIKKYSKPSTAFTGLLQLSLPFSLYVGFSMGVAWYWWAACIFFYTVIYSLTGNNVALHRYFTHSHFSVSKPVEYFFLWASAMSGVGEPVSYAMTHLIHHKYPDTEFDPHGPVRGRRSWFIYFQKTVDPSETPVFSRRLVELSSKYGWLHRYYIPFIFVNGLIMCMIDIKVFLFLWLIPSAMACWGIGWAVWRQHWNFKPANSDLHHWDVLYEGLHKHHHDYPAAPNTALYPGEIDWTYQFAKIYRPKFYIQRQPQLNDQTIN